MNIDKITLDDLSVLKGNHSVFSLINRCISQEGVDILKQHVCKPPGNFTLLKDYQNAVRFWMTHSTCWPSEVTNGTLVMVQKFYATNDFAIDKPNAFNYFMTELMQKIFHKNRYSFVLFSMGHLSDFVKGCSELTSLLSLNPPSLLRDLLEPMQQSCQLPLVQEIIQTGDKAGNRQRIELCYQARKQLRGTINKLINLFAQLDAIRAMALAGIEHNWVLPELKSAENVKLNVSQLVHPLLAAPVGYNLSMNAQRRFLFLTGANMSGKSTLLYALGIGALLAHLGMAVPAKKMEISFFEGIITNMHIEDNILLGESYFFAEVQRMKKTAQKLSKHKSHLVLMDELFKGTNGYDAFECSYAVIKGLLNKTHSLMALSTHLSELSDKLSQHPEIIFRYCQINKDNQGHYHFTYQLKEGVSKDRIGFLILKNEGIFDVLKKGT